MKIKSLLLDGIILSFLLTTATGLFFTDPDVLKENFNHYSRVAMACFVVGLIAAAGAAALNLDTLGQRLFNFIPSLTAEEAKPWYKTLWGIQTLVGFAVTFAVSVYTTEFSLREMLKVEGVMGALRIFGGMADPSIDIIPSAILAMMETVFMAFLATTLAIPFAFVLSFVCAKNVMGTTVPGSVVYFSLRMLLNLVRSMEPIVWAIIFSVWVGLGPFAGTLALMIHSVASLTKQYSEMVEAIDKGPIEGIQSTGAGALQVIWFAIVPQVILPYVSFTIYRWDINVRMATIIGLVGGGGIGNMLIQYQNQAQWNEVGALILLIAFVVWAMDAASAYIREAVK